MTSDEIQAFINFRCGELTSSEILELLDISKTPQLIHIIYENDLWEIRDYTGRKFLFHDKRQM